MTWKAARLPDDISLHSMKIKNELEIDTIPITIN